MSATHSRTLADAVREVALPLVGSPEDLAPVLAHAATTRLVLIGEASHGTHEFYRLRAELTKRLIEHHGFTGVALEADWPDAHRVHRWVQGRGPDADATEALAGFRRFPQWMWRNADMLDFVGWVRSLNDARPDPATHVGIHGLDLYSLHASMAAVIDYLRGVDPDAAERAVRRYGCFDRHGDDPQAYGHAATIGLAPSCEHDVVQQLVELQRTAAAHVARDGRLEPDAVFAAGQNARLVANAERYYRAMFGPRAAAWNVRDLHMAETLEALRVYLGRGGREPRLVVWAHNSHLGDARATDMSLRGELNLGQLVREHHAADACLVGFSTYEGTVTAARDWGGPAERRTVRPALAGSHEALLHEAGGNLLLDLRASAPAARLLAEPRLQRAIGVIYRPETERWSHYYEACLPRQFDWLLHYDRTRAVEPLERTGTWERGEMPETWPTAL